jgi:cell wall-associated NlpC family hydrolase
MSPRLPGKGRRTTALAAVAVAAVVAGGLAAYGETAAGAAPKPTVAQVRSQVNSLQAQADQIGQQYIQVGQQLTSAKAQLATVQQQSRQAEAKFTAARTQLQRLAVAQYENAGQSSVSGLLTSGDPTQVLRQASLLQQMGDARSAQVASFLGAAQQLATSRDRVQRTEAGVAQLQSQLAAKKTRLDRLLASGRATLDSLNLQQQAAVATAAVGGGGGGFTTHATYTGPTDTPGEKAVAFAYTKLGTWYLWGGTGPQYDCSGLTQAAWASAGVSIPRVTYDQYSALPHVAKSDLQPGDLVFFDGVGHVSMYVGNGLMIDAPSTGLQVRLLPLDTDWYSANYDGAVRP